MPAIITTAFRVAQGFTFNQASPLDVWVITHNLNVYPTVTVVDTDGNVIHCDVKYNSLNQVEVKFIMPFAGTAYLR